MNGNELSREFDDVQVHGRESGRIGGEEKGWWRVANQEQRLVQ